MANRYANLVGSNKIKDEYTKINTGFDKVEQEMDAKPDKSIAQVNDVQMGTDDTLTIEGSTGITVTTNPSQKKVTITATGTSTPGPHGPSHNNDGADPIPDLQNLTNEFDAHKAETVQDGVHGMGSAAAQNYEMGTWTPSLRFGGSEDGVAYSSRSGRYVRIGNMVFWEMEITLTSKGTATGNATIAGLPFSSAVGAPNRSTAIGSSTNIIYPDGITGIYVELIANSNMFLVRGYGSDKGFTNLTDENFRNTSLIRAEGTYARQ